MDKIRFGLWFGLLAAVWISYTTWVEEHQPEPTPIVAGDEPGIAADELPAPAAGGDLPSIGGAESTVPALSDSEEPATTGRLITVSTDVLDLVISLDGGDIVRADISNYPVDKANPDVPVRLLDYLPERLWVFQTGMVSRADSRAPTHQESFTATGDSFRLAEGAETLDVRLAWSGPDGLTAEKIYTFTRGSYAIALELVVRNQGADAWPEYRCQPDCGSPDRLSGRGPGS